MGDSTTEPESSSGTAIESGTEPKKAKTGDDDDSGGGGGGAATATTAADATAAAAAAAVIDVEEETRALEEQREAVDRQNAEIEQEQKSVPLVGEKEDIATLTGEFDPETAPEFAAKASELAGKYKHIRRIRRDGNCFYRSVLVAEVERMFAAKAELERFTKLCRDWRQKLINLGFAEFTTDDFCQVFYDFLGNVVENESTSEVAFLQLREDQYSNYYVIFMRLIASGFLKTNEETYKWFVDDGRPLSDYCQSEIESMWKDADHLAITGLVGATGIRLRIEYMDRTAAPAGGNSWHYDFEPPDDDTAAAAGSDASSGGAAANKEPDVYLLYRPGHYDILYK